MPNNDDEWIRSPYAKLPEYISWSNMKSRCLKPNNDAYRHYGGRGITIADEWVNDFVAFATYLGRRPTPKHTLDRIDVNGNYEPGNVRWATKAVQSVNTRNASPHPNIQKKTSASGKVRWLVRIERDKCLVFCRFYTTIEKATTVRDEVLASIEGVDNPAPIRIRIPRATHCVHGHEYTPDNTYMHGGGQHCRACWKPNRDRKRVRRLALKARELQASAPTKKGMES